MSDMTNDYHPDIDNPEMFLVRREWLAMARLRAAKIKAHKALNPGDRNYEKHQEFMRESSQRSEDLVDRWLALRWAREATTLLPMS